MKPSRAMISGEMSWAFVALAFAWAGVTQGSYLNRLLEQHAEPLLWGVLLAGPALVLMALSVREWIAHSSRRCWGIVELEASARWRGRLCLALIAGWLYMLKIAATFSSGANATSAVALGGVVFMLWFYIQNRRVQREIRVQTAQFGAAAPG